MKKKILKIIGIVLIIIILAVVVYEIYIQYDGILDKSNPMSREEVIELLNKGNNYDNYLILWRTGAFIGNHKENIIQETYVKGNSIRTTLNGKEFTWTNYDENIRIQFLKFPLVAISNESDYNDSDIQKPRNRYYCYSRNRNL